MAIILGTDENGYVTYVNQPETDKTLSKNDNYLPEEAKEEITDDYKEYVDERMIYNESTDTIDIDHFLYTKNPGGAGYPVVSSPTDGNRVGFMGAVNLNTLNVSVQNGTAGSAFTTRAISLGGSDKRLKENIKPCSKSGLELINKLDVVEFDWKHTNEHSNFGIIAQDVLKLDNNLTVGEETEDSYLGINTLYLCDVLIKAVQELSKEVEKLKGR